VGENGAGKTTMLKLVLGELTAMSGFVHAHRGIRFGYFNQHHVDQLTLDITPVGLLQQKFPGKIPIPIPDTSSDIFSIRHKGVGNYSTYLMLDAFRSNC
jgi:ATPase subunit of ABC transporter with duplicated ATPase domains